MYKMTHKNASCLAFFRCLNWTPHSASVKMGILSRFALQHLDTFLTILLCLQVLLIYQQEYNQDPNPSSWAVFLTILNLFRIIFCNGPASLWSFRAMKSCAAANSSRDSFEAPSRKKMILKFRYLKNTFLWKPVLSCIKLH